MSVNPWNLTDREEQSLRLLIEHGSQKMVAMTMNIAGCEVSKVLTKAQKKMDERTHLRAVLAFDRWARENP